MLPGKNSVKVSSALAPSLVVHDQKCTFVGALVQIDKAATSGDYFLHALDASALPANGAVTFLVHPAGFTHTIGAYTNLAIDLGETAGIIANSGVVLALSTSQFTLTISSQSVLCGTGIYNAI